jgi:hypothetical protein
MVKILSIVWYKVLPPVFGGQKGIAGFNKQLAKHHPLVCLCSKNNEPADDLFYKVLPQLPTGKLQFINPFVWWKIRAVAKKEKTTHIICEHPYHGIAAFLAAKATNAKLIVHLHNIESERFKQAGKFWWRILRVYERWVHRKADLSLFKTFSDMEFANKQFALGHLKSLRMPYGIERPILNEKAGWMIRQRHGIAENESILLFAGTLDYLPNATAVVNIYRKLFNELEKFNIPLRIIICGRNRHPSFRYLNDLSHPSILRIGEVDDIENYFQAADVFINPVLQGGGLQTKNFDAIANHCNVVCFDNMNAGLPLQLYEDKLLFANEGDWNGFAALTIKLLQQKEKTPDAFFTYFGWEESIRRLNDALKTL